MTRCGQQTELAPCCHFRLIANSTCWVNIAARLRYGSSWARRPQYEEQRVQDGRSLPILCNNGSALACEVLSTDA